MTLAHAAIATRVRQKLSSRDKLKRILSPILPTGPYIFMTITCRAHLLEAELRRPASATPAHRGQTSTAPRAWQESTMRDKLQLKYHARAAARASTGLLKDKPLKHRARPAARASTGLLKDKRLRLRARPAARASTGWLQDKPLKHLARSAARASTGWTDPLKHRARPAARASTGLLKDKRLRHRARPAARASTGLLQDKPVV
jgi:hypothetical protein